MSFDLSQLIGFTEEEAMTELNKSGLIVRIRRRDTQSFMLTMDFRRDRVNLEIDNGRVTKALIG